MSRPTDSAHLTENERARQLLPSAATRLLDWRFFQWYWGDAIAVDALLDADALIGGFRDAVVRTVERWAVDALPSYTDALAPGGAIFHLAHAGAIEERAAQRVREAIDRLPKLFGGVPMLEPHLPPYRFGVCVDALYHLPVALAVDGRLRCERDRVQRAVRMAHEMVESLLCSYGIAQWYDAIERRNNGIAWSRGMGWALLGLLDLLEELDGPVPGALEDACGRFFEDFARAQNDDGHWPTVLGDEAAGTETSSAAFFVAAAHHPRAAPIGAVPSQALVRARAACVAAFGPDGTYTGVSIDVFPNWEVAGYRHPATAPSPWGQGAALRALTAMTRASA